MTRRPGIGLAALAAFAIALATYAFLAAPTVMFGDSAEFQTVGLVGGIPHATGYPGFVLVARLFGHLPLADPAFRITFMSAFFGAASLALFVLFLGDLEISPLPALVAALALGSSFTFWRVSLRAEVYPLSIFLALLALWRTLAALRSGRHRDALIAGLLIGLSLTVHLSFILPAAALGLTLAWRAWRAGPGAPPRLATLLGAFLLGLTPYLYLAWADAHHATVNYLRLVETVQSPSGAPLPGLENEWQRLWWLVTSRNQYPAVPLAIAPGALSRNLVRALAVLFLFELGPVALLAAVTGFIRLIARDGAATWVLASTAGLALLFTAAVAGGPLVHIFLLPATVTCAAFVAADLETMIGEKARLSGVRAGLLAALALAALALPPHFVRMQAYHHGLGPHHLQVEEEDPSFKPAALPSMRGFMSPREYGTRALAAIPRGALVLADWPEYTNLQYFRVVEGRRLELTLQPMSRETLRERLRLWQRGHDPARHPFVFSTRPPAALVAGATLDSIAIGNDRWLWVRRAPIR
jgi:hypothetical protein